MKGKKLIAVFLCILMLATSIAIPSSIVLGKSSSLFNFECKNAVNDNGTYKVNDSNGTLSFGTWSNITVNSDNLYNQNGYGFANINSLKGKDEYRIEFKVKKDGNEAVTAALFSMGTNNSTSANITSDNTTDIIQYHIDGRLYVAGNDKGYITATPQDTLAYYTLLFDKNNITITLNGQVIYTQELDSDEISLFENASYIGWGTQATGKNNYGYYTGNINCSYYYLRAYEEGNFSETVNQITVDPVVYTHGYYDGTNDFMMYGTQIADGSNALEQKTKFYLPQGAVLKDIYCYDNENVGYTYADNSYCLSGSFSQDKYNAKDSSSQYVTVRFDYTLGQNEYYEYHRINVKTNPVPVHASIYAQAYTNITVRNKRVVSFETVALGSDIDNSTSTKTAAWSGSVSHSDEANNWNILSPFSSSHPGETSNNGTLVKALIGNTLSSPVNKNSGFAVTGTSTGNADIGMYTKTAKYYVDKSYDSILGAKHTAGSNDYYIEMKTENIYQTFDTSATGINVVQHQSWNGRFNVSGTTLGDNSWDKNNNASETVKLSAKVSDGSKDDEYWAAGYHGNSTKSAKATTIIPISVTVFDKTDARNALSKYSTNISSKKYESVSWRVYRNAYLALEEQLANYEISNVDTKYITDLGSAYNNLTQLSCDYSALNAILSQCKNALDNKNIFKQTTDLEALYNETTNKAFDSNGDETIVNQSEVDALTANLIMQYTETVLNRQNVDITLRIFVDGALTDTQKYSAQYGKEFTLDASSYLSDSSLSVAKWSEGKITLATNQNTYSFTTYSKHNIDCYISKEVQENDQKEITLLNRDGTFNTKLYLNGDTTLYNAVEACRSYSKSLLNYKLTSWLVNGNANYSKDTKIGTLDKIVITPIYTPGADFTVVINSSSQSYSFDDPAYVESNDNDFLFWALKYDDSYYRLVSYSNEYHFYVSGNMTLVAVTRNNFDSYKNKVINCPTLDEISEKKPIASIRGIAEDSNSLNGIGYDKENHKFTVVCQVSEGSTYDDCGAVLLYKGKVIVTHSVSQTESNQYLMSYKLPASFEDRSLKVKAYVEKDSQRYYSNEVEFTVPGDSSSVEISKSQMALTYNLNGNAYSIEQNGNSLLKDVNATFKLGNTDISLADYSYSSHSSVNFNDALGYGTMLTVNLKAKQSSNPNVTQIFKVYDQKPFVTTKLIIKSTNNENIESNYICPVFVDKLSSINSGSQPWAQFLKVPFDNDGWVKFENAAIKQSNSGTSHEVTAIYDAENKKGFILGSLNHDTWKTGIDFVSGDSGITSLKVYGGAGDTLTRGETTHGTVKSTEISSPEMFIGNYADWQDGLNEYAKSNELITPSKSTCDDGVPFGWNSWGAVQTNLNYNTAVGISDYIASNLQSSWQKDNDVPVYVDLDSYWDMLSDDELKNFAQHCKANNQKPGIYWAPFVTWYGTSELGNTVPGTDGKAKFEDIVLKKYDGSLYGNELDGCIPLDVTNPYTKMYIKDRLEKFKSWGYEYIKLDFLVHGSLEGIHYDSNVQTGIQAYNMGMSFVNDIIGDSMFINLAMSPTFPHQYSNGRRISCDVYYSTSETEYALNALTYGFWEKEIYKYPDPDHTLVWGKDGKASEAEARSQVTLGAICGTTFMMGDDFVSNTSSNAQNRFSNFLKNDKIIALAKTGKTFTPIVNGNYDSSSNIYKLEANGKIYYAVFNFRTSNTVLRPSDSFTLPLDGDYTYTTLWGNSSGEANGNLTINLNAKDAEVYEFVKK